MALSVFSNIVKWAGGVLSPASPQSSAAPTMPDVRVTNRKYSFDVLSGALPSNAWWYSPWYDTTISGAQYVSVSATSDGWGNISQLAIQQTDFISDTNTSFNGSWPQASASYTTFGGSTSINGAVSAFLRGSITTRYYRVAIFNGSSSTDAKFHAVATESTSVPTYVANFGGSIVAGQQLGADPTTVNNSNGPLGPSVYNSNGQFYPNGLLGQAPYISTDGSATNCSIVRTPYLRRGAQFSASGPTAIWTPQTGKKVRLMNYKLEVSGNATLSSAAVASIGITSGLPTTTAQNIPIQTGMGYAHQCYIPASAPTAPLGNLYDSDFIMMGNGFLLGNANAPLLAGINVPQSTSAITPTFTLPTTGQWEAATIGFKTAGSLGAFRLVQTLCFAGTGAATYALTALSNAPGNAIIVVCKTINSATGIPAFSMSANTAGDTYTATAVTTNTSDVGATNGSSLCILYTLSTKGSAANVLTVATTDSPTQCEIIVLEYSGVGSGGVDAALVGTTGSSTTPSSGAYTPATAGDLLITACSTGTSETTQPTIAGAWTMRGTIFNATQGTLCVADNFGNVALAGGAINFIGMGTEE